MTTGHPLSDFRANLFIGRATRVHSVYLPEAPTVFYALKLLWLAVGAVPEHITLQNILNNVKKEKRRFFPTFLCAGFQKVKDNNGNDSDDSTDNFIPSSFKRIAWYPTSAKRKRSGVLRTRVSGTSRSTSSGAIYSTPGHIPMSSLLNDSVVNVSFFRKEYFIPRIQYYIVYREVGIALHDVKNFHHVLLALTDTVYGVSNFLCSTVS